MFPEKMFILFYFCYSPLWKLHLKMYLYSSFEWRDYKFSFHLLLRLFFCVNLEHRKVDDTQFYMHRRHYGSCKSKKRAQTENWKVGKFKILISFKFKRSFLFVKMNNKSIWRTLTVQIKLWAENWAQGVEYKWFQPCIIFIIMMLNDNNLKYEWKWITTLYPY